MNRTLRNYRGSPYYGFRLSSNNQKSHTRKSQSSIRSPKHFQLSLSPKNTSSIIQKKPSKPDKTKKELYLFRDSLLPDKSYLPFLCSLRQQPPSIKTSKNLHQFSVASKNTFCSTSKSKGKEFESSYRINPFQHVWRLKSNKSVRDNVNFQSELRNYEENPEGSCKHTVPFGYLNVRLERREDVEVPEYGKGEACEKYLNTMEITKKKRWKKSLTTID